MSSTPTLPPIPSSIASIAGPPLIGIMLNWLLYGILITQTYVYVQCFPNDKKKIKALVYGIFALDTLQTVLAAADAFHWFAEGYGNMRVLADPFISPFDAPMLDGSIAFIVQVFFCWRIWVLQKSIWLPLIVLLSSLIAIGGAIAHGIGMFQLGNLTLLYTLKSRFCFWLGGTVLADTMIAVIMTSILLRARDRQHRGTDHVLVRIIRLTVQTNSVTASVAIVDLVCLLAVNGPHSTASTAPAYVLGKLYSNTLMAVLNNRVYMSAKGISPRNTQGDTGMSDMSFGPHALEAGDQQSQSRITGSREGPYRIEVFQDIDVTTDVSTNVSLKDFEVSKPRAIV